jgi:exodeoxyribonuclease VII large subunit
MLFPALLQGDQAVTSIMAQLDRIKKVISHFDAVAVIRGGGGDIGLTCYNNLDLVRRLALFPIPVLTGIGHSTNETVAEMVAMKNAITPTELADFLIQRFHNFLVPVNKAEELIVQASGEITASAQRALMQQVMSFRQATLTSIERRKFKVHRLTGMLARLADQFHSVAGNELKSMHTNLNSSIQQYHQQRRVQLEHMEKIVELLDPLQVLKRGYTLSVVNNKIVRSVTDVIPGEPLVTLFSDGRVISDVREIEKN